MPATRGSYGFPLFSSCRDDDELLQYPSAFMAEASGRSMSCRGFVEKDGAHDVSSSSRWPHEYCAHMQVPAASLRTCPYCFSTIVCSGWGAQSVEGTFGSGQMSTCHRGQQQQNRKPHLWKNSHACCGGAAINFKQQPHDPHSYCTSSCPPNKQWWVQGPSKQQSRAAAVGPLGPPPPFPSAHGAPYVLCQHCALLLLLPPGTLLLSRSPALFTLRCGSCLNFSTFSTRHLYTAPSASPPPFSSPKEPTESTSMPGYGTFHGGIMQESQYSAVCGSASQVNCAIAHENSVEYGIDRQNSKKVSHPNGLSEHGPTERGEIKAVDDALKVSLESTEHAEAHVYSDCVSEIVLQKNDSKTVDSLNGISACALQERTDEARDCKNRESIQIPQEKNIESCSNISEFTLDNQHNKLRESDTGALIISEDLIQEGSHWDREQEIVIISSVQSWVDSLSPDAGYESDSLLHCSGKCAIGCEKHGHALGRSALHQHFGYKSPLELFEKVISSEDEEMRARTETNSTASSSSSPNNTCQHTDVRATDLQVRDPSLRAWSGKAMKSDDNSSKIEGRDTQRSLSTRLFKRGLGNHSPASLKSKVVVNGHVLSTAAIKRAEDRAGKLRPGSYWYDCKAGFWGVEGGSCLGILPPLIEELSYPMAGNCSNGDTQVYVNGRELHLKDLGILSQRGFPDKVGRAYSLGFDGVLVDDTTGLEVTHLGKLAPTVERKGKGFGMFAGGIAQVMKPLVPVVQSTSANGGH